MTGQSKGGAGSDARSLEERGRVEGRECPAAFVLLGLQIRS